ncbi:hypothetical protein GCM10020001_119110 [Nonomuraea salmonea]
MVALAVVAGLLAGAGPAVAGEPPAVVWNALERPSDPGPGPFGGPGGRWEEVESRDGGRLWRYVGGEPALPDGVAVIAAGSAPGVAGPFGTRLGGWTVVDGDGWTHRWQDSDQRGGPPAGGTGSGSVGDGGVECTVWLIGTPDKHQRFGRHPGGDCKVIVAGYGWQ